MKKNLNWEDAFLQLFAFQQTNFVTDICIMLEENAEPKTVY